MLENASDQTAAEEREAQQRQAFFEAFAAAPQPVITYTLITINFLVFLAMVVKGISFMDPTAEQVLPWGANFAPMTLNGDWWRLITACFLHFGIIHIAMNMFILFQVGVFTEKIFGHVRYLVLYLLAGIVGNIAGLYIHPTTVSAGASGAVFGVYGALLAFLLVQRGTVPKSSSLPIAKSAGIFLAYNLIYGLSNAHTDMTAHVGGLISGFIVGGLLARPISASGQRTYPIRTLAVLLGSGAIAYLAIRNAPRERDPQRLAYQHLQVGPKVTVGKNDRVAYRGTATMADAESLAQALLKVGYFKNPNVLIMLSKGPSGTVISIPTWTNSHDDKGSNMPWEDIEFLAGIQGLGVTVAPSVGGPPVKIQLLDDEGNVKKKLDIDAREAMIGKEDSVWYSGAATEENARTLGASLQTARFFQDKGGRAMISRDGSGTQVSLIVRAGVWDDPSMAATVQFLGHTAQKAVGGGPLHLHLLDKNLVDKKELLIP
jgi:rhomboid protease GluP